MELKNLNFIQSGLMLLVVLVLITRGSDIFTQGLINQQALQVVDLCLREEPNKGTDLVTGSESMVMTWLIAQRANCQQDLQAAEVAWQQTLDASPERLSLIRSAVPYHLVLAQYAATRYPEQAEAFFWLGDAYKEQGDNLKAVQAYEAGLILQPEQDANAWMSVGRLYEAEGDWERAVHAYDQACHYVDRGKNGCPGAGRLYFEHEQYELAAQRYREAMQQLPYWQPARLGLARTLLAMGQIEEARLHLTFLANEGNTIAQTLLNQLSENQTQP